MLVEGLCGMRRLLFGACVAFVLTGCVSVSPPVATTAPSGPIIPTLAPVTTPASVTAAPTLPPVATAVPTSAPTAQPTTAGSQAGTNTSLWVDDLSNEESGWITGSVPGSFSAAYDNGALALSATGNGLYLISPRSLNGGVHALRLEGMFTPQSGGGDTGLHCSDGANLLGGGVGTDGSYFLYSRTGSSGAPEILQRETTDPLTTTGIGSTFTMSVECAIGQGVTDVWLAVNGELLLHSQESGSPLSSFSVAGAYAKSTADSLATRLESVSAWADAAPVAQATTPPTTAPTASPTKAPTTPPSTDGVLGVVPSAMQSSCQPYDSSYSDATESVSCTARSTSGDIVSIYYHQFGSTADMDSAFDGNVSLATDPEDGGECEDDTPGIGSWNIDGDIQGRYLCLIFGGIPTITWTATALNVMAQAYGTADKMDELWEVWAESGPIIDGTTPTETAAPAAGIEEHIPASLLADCKSITPYVEDAVETWQCDPDTDTTIFFLGFANEDAARDYFDLGIYDGIDEGSDCTNGEADGHGTYTIDGVEAGEYTCGSDLAGALITWMRPPLPIVVELRNHEYDYDQAWKDWEDAGPDL